MIEELEDRDRSNSSALICRSSIGKFARGNRVHASVDSPRGHGLRDNE